MKHFLLAALLRTSGVALSLVAAIPDATGAPSVPAERHATARDATSNGSFILEGRLAWECTASRMGWPLALRWMRDGRGRGVRLVVDACLPLPPRVAAERRRPR